MRFRRRLPLIVLLSTLPGCGGDDAPDGKDARRTPPVDAPQDIRTTDLTLDLGALSGTAVLSVAPASGSGAVRLDVHGLDVRAVRAGGAAVDIDVQDGTLVVPVSADSDAVEIGVDYGFPARTVNDFDGWMPDLGVSFIWSKYCGNLFPCDPAMADGVVFSLAITGYDPALTAVYPTNTYSDAPSYMPGIAVGDYAKIDLGATPAGTHLYAWYYDVPGALGDAQMGTEHLVDAVDFYESTYGPYAFGPEMGTVQVNWGAGSYGGMEHHPYFHVGMYDFWDEEAQIHEAGHGWFGDGVRLECWEDFVLSEGTTTYIAARASEEVGGYDFWAYYVDDFLEAICDGRDVNAVVLPDTCNAIDFENSNVWSLASYMKGACFYEDVADVVGVDVVDATIAEFYQANVNQTAQMEEMIDLLVARSDPGYAEAIEGLADEWLRTYACPADYAARCRAHAR